MKLRIQGNSLRLRLSGSEVERIGQGLTVEETIEFGGEPAQRLIYALAPSDEIEQPKAVFKNGRLAVFLPKAQAAEWARTNQIGIEAEKTIGSDGRTLRILIEKDFSHFDSRALQEDSTDSTQSAPKNKIQLQSTD